tara:strand:+ start:116 stop:577 length:462 start_codon:yes stop_codon:yes gene_type:complete
MNTLKDNKSNKSSGFSLIEILVVLLIIGLLSSLVVVNVLPSQDRARVEKAKTDISIIEGALEMYRLEKFSYPNNEEGLIALLKPNSDNYQTGQSSRGYIKRLPKDPWGNEYQYLIPGDYSDYSDYDLFSLGADGQEGGKGLNADIGNWTQEVE